VDVSGGLDSKPGVCLTAKFSGFKKTVIKTEGLACPTVAGYAHMPITGGATRKYPIFLLQYGGKVVSGSTGFSARVRPRCIVFPLAAFRLKNIIVL
jgi:hypothetical protein